MALNLNRLFIVISIGLLFALGHWSAVAQENGGAAQDKSGSAAQESGAAASEAGGAAALAAKLQDPLATISAIETDNFWSRRAGEDNDDNYTIQFQPAYSLNFPDWGFSVVPRANIPIIGLKPGTDLRIITTPEDEDDVEVDSQGREWGLGDIVTQFFVAPMGQGTWKVGLGPQISWRTRTDNDVKGAGAGAGPTGVLVGDIGQFSLGAMFGHLWGFDGDFSTTSVQPFIYYNFKFWEGSYVYYNNVVSYDHKTKGGNGNSWTVPLGAGVGKTFAVGDGGHGFDISLGGYHLPTWGRPSGGEEYQIQLKLSWIFPR